MHHQNRRADINGILYLLVDFHTARCRKVFSVKIPGIFSGFFDSFQCYRQSTHLQLHTLIRCLSVFSVNVPFSIQHIILQHSKCIQIVAAGRISLMQLGQQAIFDTKLIQYQSRKLVCFNIAYLLLGGIICPNDIFADIFTVNR